MTLHYIDINAITIAPNRQRRHFDPSSLHSLSTSIERTGLLHPIILRTVGDDFVLVAGERRLRAVQDIYELGGRFTHAGQPVVPSLIPYTPLGDLSPLEAMEAELEENIRRVDLTWQEESEATAKLAELRGMQAEEVGALPPSIADIAQETKGTRVGTAHTQTKKQLIVARFLSNPEVAKAKTLDDAFALLKRQEVKEQNEELARTIGPLTTAKSHTLIQADSLTWLADQPSGHYDVLLTDPPYGMGADEFGDSDRPKTLGEHFYDDSYETWLRTMQLLIPAATRVCKQSAHAYLFCDIDRFPELRAWMSEAGWRVFRTPLIWYKRNAFRAPWPDCGPQRKYECILFAVRGERKVNRLSGDVLEFTPDVNLGHQAQKPVALYTELLARSARPGDQVLDPFCGTGPIFPAAQAMTCFATGVEQDAGAYRIAAARLEELRG